MILPTSYQIASVEKETKDVFTLTLAPLEGTISSFMPGQFNMVYVFGFGEIALSISSDPKNTKELSHTIRAIGPVTMALQKLKIRDILGVRGPFGKPWPEPPKGDDVLVIAGGLGLAPLSPLLHTLAKDRKDYGKITLLYGARAPDDLFFQRQREAWNQLGIEIVVSVDKADTKWKGHVGVIPSLIANNLYSPYNTSVYLCGPEVMMQFSLHELNRYAIRSEKIFLSMERNMQCATGFCGHCQYGPYFLCKDGPVFCYENIKRYLAIKEL